MLRQFFLSVALLPLAAWAQPCMTDYTLTVDPPPVNGTYGCGQTVTFCMTVTNWNATNANWFHGVEANFGPGWDVATLVPGTPPATCGPSTGSWAWYGVVSGQGPGFFFDLDSDGDPSNNFGDYCTGATDWEFCWTIDVLSAPACANGLGLGVNINTFSDSQTGSWGSNGCGGDDNPPVFPGPVVIQTCTAEAGDNAVLDLCSTSGPAALGTVLGGVPDAGGSWTDPSGAVHTDILDPATDANGAYTYTVSGAGCSDQAVVMVTIHSQPDAGSDGATTVCASDATLQLADLLNGTPEAGGTWSDPNGDPFPGTFDPATDAPGNYIYRIDAPSPCVAALATVMIDVNPTPTAGANGNLALCSTASPAALFTALAGTPDASGTWTDASGSTFSGTYDPAVHAPGVFTYTVPGTAPCPNSAATVTVAEHVQPDAGNGAVLSFCATQAPVALNTLLEGTPDAGGAWSGPGGATASILDPSTAASGSYTYTVNAIAPCVAAMATLDITVVPAADAGTDSNVNLCEGSAPVDLFTELGGTPDAGGTWTGPNGSPAPPLFDPLLSLDGTFTYTVTGSTPCADHSAAVTVNVTLQPDAGDDVSTMLCTSGPDVSLFVLLNVTAQPGGVWTDPNGDPVGIDLVLADALSGDYLYTVPGTAPCVDDQAVLNIQISSGASAGTDGSTTLCSASDPVDLFDLLGGSPEPAGSWTGPGGGAVGSTFDPYTQAAGDYTYTVESPAPCPWGSAVVSVAVEQQYDAGENGTFSICATNTAMHDLLGLLNGTPQGGGVWTAPDGTAHGLTFDAAADPEGLYTYTFDLPAPCVSVSSTVEIELVDPPDAGPDAAVIVCEDAQAIDPSTWIAPGADAGGTWTGPTGNAVASIDPAVGPAGSYTYTVSGQADCPEATSAVVLSISTLPNAGDDATLDLCPEAAATPLMGSLGGNAEPGGMWTGPDGPLGGTFIPGTSTPGTYIYAVAGTGGCSGSSATANVTVSVLPAPAPLFTVGTPIGCAPLQTLFTYTGTPAQIATWAFGDGTTSADLGPAHHIYAQGGAFDVQLTVTDANGCSATVVVPDAVQASDGPEVFFVPSPLRVSVEDPVFNVAHVPVEGVTYTWTVDDAAIDAAGPFQHTIAPSIVGLHPICLTATDDLGCTNATCIDIEVDDVLTVYVPNAFTPDGNGVNEVFRPSVLGAEPQLYSFRIFDRWGNEVFSTTDLNEGWNGARGNSGGTVQQDVYVWRLLAHDQFTTERREFTGTVTVLK